MGVRAHDPVSVEIHRKALENITNEMAIALTRTSGSPVVYEVQDFATSLMDIDGEHLSISSTVLLHAGSSLLGTRSVLELLGEDRAARPGDGWIVNDPFTGGALHQGDVGIIMPNFYRDEQIGWSFANVHILDVGGVGVSGFAPGAQSVYEEGVRFPATQVIWNGKIDQGWADYIAANVRIPDLVLNDIRAMMAANNVAQDKLVGVIDRWGLEQFNELCELNKSLSEAALRARIEKLPDGVYETSEWMEFDGHGEDLLIELRCRMEVDGSGLRFQIGGEEQINAFLNGTTGVVYGSVMAALRTTLGYGDLPFNAGLWRPLTIDNGPPGSVVNATPPMPVSSGHGVAGLQLGRAIKDCLNQALALSSDPAIRARVAGTAHDALALVPLAGAGHGGNPTVVFYQDLVIGSGGGAQSGFDGQDCYGVTPTPGCGMTSVETNEAQQPSLYLWRRLLPNSGGPGTFRGGQAIESAYAVYDTDELAGAVTMGCAQTPARGVGGGLPSAASKWAGYHDTNVESRIAVGKPVGEETLTGDCPPQPSNKGRLVLARGDVVRMSGGGGGGLGDPLLRDPRLVARDLRDGYVTNEHARTAYGVALDGGGEVDEEETERLRTDIRRRRLGAESDRPQRRPASPGVSVALSSDGKAWLCAYCESALGSAGEDWRQQAKMQRRTIADHHAELGMYVRDRNAPRFMLVEYCCDSCAGLLAVDTFPEGFAGYPPPRIAP
jgi:N-methylhydantoinase B